MTAPDKVWIADPYLSAVDGSIQAGTYSPCSDWHFKHEYTRTDPKALIAAAFEAAAKFCEDNEVGTSTRLGYVVAPFYRDENSGKHPGMAYGDPIRALTPPDAQAALQAMIDAAERRGMQQAIDLINENTSPMVAPPTWSRDETEGYENGQMDAAQSFVEKIRIMIGGASNA